MPQPSSAPWSRIVNAVLIVAAFALLGGTVWQNRDAIREVFERPIASHWLGWAFTVYLLALVLTFIRWYILVRAQGLPFRVRDALRLGFIGNVFNLVIPGAVGGDLIKAGFLYREHARKTQAIGSMVIDRAAGLIGLFVLAGIMGVWIWPEADQEVRRLILVAWAAVAAGGFGLLLLFTPALYRPAERLVAGRKRLETILTELVAMASSYRERVGTVLGMIAMATAIHALYVLSFYLVSRALFPNLPSLAQHFLIVPLILFTTAVPLPFGALGLSEQVSGRLFGLVHHPAGAVAMIGYRVLMYAGGLVSVGVYGVNISQVRALAREAEEGSSLLELDDDSAPVHPVL